MEIVIIGGILGFTLLPGLGLITTLVFDGPELCSCNAQSTTAPATTAPATTQHIYTIDELNKLIEQNTKDIASAASALTIATNSLVIAQTSFNNLKITSTLIDKNTALIALQTAQTNKTAADTLSAAAIATGVLLAKASAELTKQMTALYNQLTPTTTAKAAKAAFADVPTTTIPAQPTTINGRGYNISKILGFTNYKDTLIYYKFTLISLISIFVLLVIYLCVYYNIFTLSIAFINLIQIFGLSILTYIFYNGNTNCSCNTNILIIDTSDTTLIFCKISLILTWICIIATPIIMLI